MCGKGLLPLAILFGLAQLRELFGAKNDFDQLPVLLGIYGVSVFLAQPTKKE